MAFRIRSIKPELWSDQLLQRQQREIRLLFIGLISHADDEGRLEGDASLIRSRVFPADRDVSTRKVEGWLERLYEAGFIRLYQANAQPYIEVTNFKRHQRINRPTPSRLPAPSMNDHGVLHENSLIHH